MTGLLAGSIPEILTASASSKSHIQNENEQNLTVLFQGDSITDGNRSRDNDWNHLMGHGYAYLISSRLWYDHPDRIFMFYNRGISGNKISDLEARWQEDAIDLKPDIISILVGINDVHAIINGDTSETSTGFEKTYQQIIDKTGQTLPNSKIVLCEPFVLPAGWVKDNFDTWKEEVEKRQHIVRQLAEVNNTIFIELQEPFNQACKNAPADYWSWDGIHPMPAGHELIAREWVKAMKDELSI